MKIQNINLLNFGLKKITNKKAYLRKNNTPKQDCDSFSYTSADKEPKNKELYQTLSPNEDMNFDKFFNKETCVASADGKVILSKETGTNLTSLELIEQDGGKTKTTKLNIDKKRGEKSNCSYKITEHGKSKTMNLDWNYPGNDFRYMGSNKELMKFKKAIQHFRNIIQSKEYAEDFGDIKEVNFQLKVILNYLHNEINNQGNK